MHTYNDLEIFEFMQNYGAGKTFKQVLLKTFYSQSNNKAVENKTNKLVKQKTLSRLNTGLITPRSCLIFGEKVKEYFRVAHKIRAKEGRVNTHTVGHEMDLQVAAYWLQKLTSFKSLKRAEVHDFKGYGHTPDLVLRTSKQDGGTSTLWIEIETTHKSMSRYNEMFSNILKANEGKLPFSKMIYITPRVRDLEIIANKIPDKYKGYVLGVSLEAMLQSIKEHGKIGSKHISHYMVQEKQNGSEHTKLQGNDNS